MKTLTIEQRAILMNQELILARLYPENEIDHKENADLYRRGIVGTYPYAVVLEEEIEYKVFNETLDILNMFIDLETAQASLSDEEKSGLDLESIAYEGFDYNINSNHVRVLDYLATKPCYKEYDKNSHTHISLIKYRKMLEIYQQEASESLGRQIIDKSFLIKMIDGIKLKSEVDAHE